MPENKKWNTRMTVLGTDIEFQGTSRRTGKEFTIYNVTALGEDGLPIDMRLRTFDDDLPQNQLIAVEVEERPDDRHGTTYTISIPGKTGGGQQAAQGGGLAGSVDDLRARVTALESQVRALAAGEKPQLESLATPPGSPGSAPTF